MSLVVDANNLSCRLGQDKIDSLPALAVTNEKVCDPILSMHMVGPARRLLLGLLPTNTFQIYLEGIGQAFQNKFLIWR